MATTLRHETWTHRPTNTPWRVIISTSHNDPRVVAATNDGTMPDGARPNWAMLDFLGAHIDEFDQ